MQQEYFRLTAHETVAGIRAGNFTARAVTQSYLDRIAAVDGQVQAYLDVWHEDALTRADEIDTAIAAGNDPGPLAERSDRLGAYTI